MVQPVLNDVSRQERSKHGETNLKLFAVNFRAVRLEWAHPVNCPETYAEIHGTFVTNNGGSRMTKSSRDDAILKPCAHQCQLQRWRLTFSLWFFFRETCSWNRWKGMSLSCCGSFN